MKIILEKIGKIISGKRIENIRIKLKLANLKYNAETFVGANFVLGIIFSMFIGFVAYKMFFNPWAALGGVLLSAVIFYIVMGGIVGLLADQRTKFVEKKLPDALLLMASNLKSGIPADDALIRSAKPEFGFLSERIKIAGNKIATGTPLHIAFKAIGKDIDSDILNQTIKLIVEGITSGGELASILEGTARDIRDNELLRKEIRAMIMLYATFIFLAVGVISPILYSVSMELAGILAKLSQTLASGFLSVEGASATIPVSITNISGKFLMVFSYTNILITSVFGSLMIALINKGNEKYGLKYIPFVTGLAILLFNLGRIAMAAFFGGIRIL